MFVGIKLHHIDIDEAQVRVCEGGLGGGREVAVARANADNEIGLAGYGPGRDEPGLYFEVRDRQKAMDPVAWLR